MRAEARLSRLETEVTSERARIVMERTRAKTEQRERLVKFLARWHALTPEEQLRLPADEYARGVRVMELLETACARQQARQEAR